MFKDRDTYFEIDDFKNFGVKAVYTTKKIGDIDILFKDSENGSENISKCFEKKMHKLSMQDRLTQIKLWIFPKTQKNIFMKRLTVLSQKEKMLSL